MSTKHTPEPWHVMSNPDLGSFVRSDDKLILAKVRECDGIDHETNAQRIVACVNAMAGIEDPKKLRETWEICKELELDKYHLLKSDHIKLCRSVREFINQFEGSIENLTSDQAIEFGILKGRLTEYERKLANDEQAS